MCNKVVADLQTPPHEGSDKKHATGTRVSTQPKQDVIAIFTIYTRILIEKISILQQWAKSTACYSLVTRTTQPAHLAIILAVLCIAATVYPSAGKSSSTTPSALSYFVYATATAIHFGSQIWMTFISGLSLYFTLPRHDFGEVQKVLFPIYFAWSAILSFIALSAQVNISGVTVISGLLATRFLLEVFVRARCCDELIHLIISKNVIEASHGLGREVGKLAADSTLFGVEEYLSLHHKFRRLHMIIAFANMAAIAISTLHLWLSLQSISITIC